MRKKNILFIFIISICLVMQTAFAKEVNIAYITDNNYVTYTLISIKSMLDNNVSNSKYKFYILENGLTGLNKKRIKNFIEGQNQQIEFINCDTTVIDGGNHMQEGFVSKFNRYIPRIVTAKLLIPEVFPDDVDKVLYLDGDTLIMSDIKELYDEDISDYIVGMAIDNFAYEHYEKSGNPITPPYYYNAGVMLYNLSKWRENNMTQKMIQYAKDNPHLPWADQDIINSVLSQEDIKRLDIKWNNQYRPASDTLCKEESRKEGIRHYFTRTKPWNFCPHNSKYKRDYLKYWSKTPFKMRIITHIPNAIYKCYLEFIMNEKEIIISLIKKDI